MGYFSLQSEDSIEEDVDFNDEVQDSTIKTPVMISAGPSLESGYISLKLDKLNASFGLTENEVVEVSINDVDEVCSNQD